MKRVILLSTHGIFLGFLFLVFFIFPKTVVQAQECTTYEDCFIGYENGSNYCCADANGNANNAVCNVRYKVYWTCFINECVGPKILRQFDTIAHRDSCYGCGCSNASCMTCPTPTPTPSPSSSPSPSPSSSASPSPSPSGSPPICSASLSYNCSVSPVGLVGSWNSGSGSDCNVYIQAGETPHVVSSACSGNNVLIQDSSYIWNGGTYQLYAIKPGGCNSSSSPTTINCNLSPPPSPPPASVAAPYYQIFMEVANKTKGESIPDDCGVSGNCASTWRWPPTCATLDPASPRPRAIRTTTQADLGDTVELKICARNMGNEDMRDTQIAAWLNQAFIGDKTLSQAAENWEWSPDGVNWQSITPQSGNYTYHSWHLNPLQVPYNWLRLDQSSCGSLDKWLYSCTANKRFRFRIKNDPSLDQQTASTKTSLRLAPYVNPHDYHPYLTACNNAQQTGFRDRNPTCCWGNKGAIYMPGWSGCPIPSSDPRYDQCRFGTCDTGQREEDFLFWSNWASIDIKQIGPWIQVTGDVHSNSRINAPGGP